MASKTQTELKVAAKAVIVNNDGNVLILREAKAKVHPTNTQSGSYQLPGGQLEPGETFEHGLKREVYEETGLNIVAGSPLLVGEWRPVVKGKRRQIIGIFISATSDTKQVKLSDEHDAYKWVDPKRRSKYDIIPPDWQAIDDYVTAGLSKGN